MKQQHTFKLAMLLGLASCSTHYHKVADKVPYDFGRKVAGIEALEQDGAMKVRTQKLVKSIFQSYLLGQVYLQQFDAHLEKSPETALQTDSYHSLLAVRTFVDKYEEEVLDLYVDLVMETAKESNSEFRKQQAQLALDEIGNFLAGLKTDQQKLPENLKPLVLANLTEKMTHAYDVLSSTQELKVDGVDSKAIHKNMVLIRATRMAYNKDLSQYHVDPQILKQTLSTEEQSLDFKQLQKEVVATKKEIKKFSKQLGRGTSEASIYPSASSNGNVTGNGFPVNTWSITYDDGPHGVHTEAVLKNLHQRGVSATFFQLAHQVELYPSKGMLVKEAAENHDIACHSYDHPQMPKQGPAGLEKQITRAKQIIEEKLGVTVKLFRLPYGAGVSKPAVRAKIAENKMIHVFWNVDTLDWQDKNPQSVFKRAVRQINAIKKNAGVILFHDIHPQSVVASALLMDHLKAQKDVKLCTVQGVIDQINENKADCK